ncbi:MAG: hypothetical protein KDE27_17475 [Planctomycetes bacterium]|nr:hypothetical protein [Planctomycetota bacterium]
MRVYPAMKTLALLLFTTVFASALLPCQQPATTDDDEDVLKAEKVDPFTDNDPELMKQAGIVRYGPFPWADFVTTDDIETVLGKGRFLWIETAHFRIGYSMKTQTLPAENEKRRFLRDEVKAVRESVPKFPARVKKLGPWVQLHLYAWRLERLYADVEQMLGVTDADFGPGNLPPNGKFLGLGDKFLVLLFEKTSDLSRYFDRFCNYKTDVAMRWYHVKTHQLLAALAIEDMEGFDATAVHSNVIYSVAHNLFSGYRGYHLELPLWLGEGLAHYFAAGIPSDVVNVRVLDSEADPERKIGIWPVKVRKRAQHEGVCFTFDQMCAWEQFGEMGYHHHAQAWSRVDFLMKRDPEKVAFMLRKLKELPPVPSAMVPRATVEALTRKLLIELFELDAAKFDSEWREWVLKTYPKK